MYQVNFVCLETFSRCCLNSLVQHKMREISMARALQAALCILIHLSHLRGG